MKPLSIPWHYLQGGELRNMKGLEIHRFSDASLKGCAAVVYFRAIMSDEIKCNIVASKTKVVPLAARGNKLTVPRLELVGCLLLSMLAKSIIHALSLVYTVSEIFTWTDSFDCKHWINNEIKVREKYVQTRVEKIRKKLPGIKWFHCPGILNLADMPSRGY